MIQFQKKSTTHLITAYNHMMEEMRNAFEQPNQSCPNCNSKGLSIFYTVDDIPVHSCLLMSSKEEALKYNNRSDLNTSLVSLL